MRSNRRKMILTRLRIKKSLKYFNSLIPGCLKQRSWRRDDTVMLETALLPVFGKELNGK